MDSSISSSLVSSKQQLFLQKCSPVFVEYQLMREFVLFQQQNLSHIYIVPSESSCFKWLGVMFIHHGLYQGIILRFTLYIPTNYPDCDCPKVVFDPIPFHPLISPENGQLNVSQAFPNWKSNINQLWQVILYAKRAFHSLDFESCDEASPEMPYALNIEALKLYKYEYKKFEAKIEQTIEECNERMFVVPDGHMNEHDKIFYGQWNAKIHEELKFKLLAGVDILEDMHASDQDVSHPSASGLSWVQKGSMQVFSKPSGA